MWASIAAVGAASELVATTETFDEVTAKLIGVEPPPPPPPPPQALSRSATHVSAAVARLSPESLDIPFPFLQVSHTGAWSSNTPGDIIATCQHSGGAQLPGCLQGLDVRGRQSTQSICVNYELFRRISGRS